MTILLLTLVLAAADAPGWLKEAGTSALPAYEAKVPAAVLVNEESVTLDATGRQLRSTRYAVKVLTRDGARHASQAVVYFTDTGKVKELKAWLIFPSGKVKEYGRADIAEGNVSSGIYDEAKYRSVDGRADADPGAVFGFEATVEEKTIFTQFIHDFQDDLPAFRSTFVLNLPAGWTAEGKVFRGQTAEALEPDVSGTTYKWQLTKLPPFEREAGAPRRTTLNPRLVVNTFRPAGAVGGHFQSWKDVSTWTSKLTDASATLTPELSAKATELTANAASSWDKLSALAKHAQGIRYESIQMNLSRGGGYTPHTAAHVLTKGYGDCKDKANYLKTLLKAINVDSYMVTIFSGDPRRTRREWPSPMQFNHAILAIKVPDEVKAPAVFDFPGIGRMLMFDPTDETVPLGYVPDHEQDSWALLLAGDRGDIFRTPATAPAANHLRRASVLKITAEGGVAATLAQHATGQEAFDQSRVLKRFARPDYLKMIEGRISRAVPGAAIAKIEPKDDLAQQRFDLDLEFSAPTYGKSMQGRLLMVKPIVLTYNGLPDLSNPKRTQPLLIDPASFSERVEMEVPAGFVVDELPDSGQLESEWGKYKAAFRAEGNKVIVERELELKSAWVPVESFKAARDFFSRVGGTEQAPVVLMRK